MTVLRVTAFAATAALVAFGVWVTGGWLSDDFRISMVTVQSSVPITRFGVIGGESWWHGSRRSGGDL